MNRQLPLLLAEPNNLLRQTVALTAGSVCLRPVHQTSTIRAARQIVREEAFGGVMLALGPNTDDIEAALEMIADLRAGKTACSAGVAIYATASACDRSVAERLQTLRVDGVILQPCRARILIEALKLAG